MEGQPGALLRDSLVGARLVYSNDDGGAFSYEPGRMTITLAVEALRREYPQAEAARLIPPGAWRVVGGSDQRLLGVGATIAWELAPGGRPDSCEQGIACEIIAGGERIGTLRHVVPIELRGRSQFDPERDILPFRNAAGDLGHIEPRDEIFRRTYRRGGTILPDAFFAGLYRDIVFLSPETDLRGGGGLCTGMARFALERSLHPGVGATAGESLALHGGQQASATEEVQAWHGRQLTDRALLAAARQFFTATPTGAYFHFRDDLLAAGRGEVAFDIGIARWEPSPGKWGEMLHRLVTQGHTIVPYAFRQVSDGAAEVSVYDPSYPDRADWADNVVRFDLINDRYTYRGFGALDRDDPTTVLAVPQRNFEGEGSAYLASLANLGLHPELLAAEWRDNGALRRNALLATGLLGAALALLGRRASSSRAG